MSYQNYQPKLLQSPIMWVSFVNSIDYNAFVVLGFSIRFIASFIWNTNIKRFEFIVFRSFGEQLNFVIYTLLFDFLFKGLVKKYPDIKVDHLTALLNLREDMAKTNVRKVNYEN